MGGLGVAFLIFDKGIVENSIVIDWCGGMNVGQRERRPMNS